MGKEVVALVVDNDEGGEFLDLIRQTASIPSSNPELRRWSSAPAWLRHHRRSDSAPCFLQACAQQSSDCPSLGDEALAMSHELLHLVVHSTGGVGLNAPEA